MISDEKIEQLEREMAEVDAQAAMRKETFEMMYGVGSGDGLTLDERVNRLMCRLMLEQLKR
jgi:hypothetical protein